MTLPFKNPSKPEIYVISDPVLGSLEFEKKGSVTYAEELQIIPLFKALRNAGESPEVTHKIQASLASIALRRLNPEWNEKDADDLPVSLIRDCSEFLLAERRQWEEQDPVAKKKIPLTGKTTKKGSENPTPTSSTDSEPLGPEMPDGAQNDSPKTPSKK